MIGTHIGPYRLLKLLGEGGMGRVFLAEHRLLLSHHAIKLLHPDLSKHEELVQRFINEGRAATALQHPNIVQLLIAQVERAGAKASLAIKAQLLVAGNGVPAIGEAYCDACSDSQLKETATQLTEQLLKDTALRTQTRETVLEIRTVPSGAAVTVDGKQVGVSDLRHRVSPGPHTVLVQRTGYEPETRTVTLADGQTSKLAVELRPISTSRPSRIVPGVVIGAGLAAVAGGSIVSFTAEDSPEGQKHEYVYSAPGIGVAIGGAVVAGAGVYLWLRASRRSSKRAVPAVSTTPGGAIAGWAMTF